MQLPAGFTRHLANCDGFDEAAFIEAHERKPFISIRVNPNKPNTSFEGCEKVSWCPTGYYLDERLSFTLDPLFHAGTYYVQEASSMFLDYLVKEVCDVSISLKVLDLCAAPGGKSTLLAGLMNSDSLLVSNEVIHSRVPVLLENLVKWGNDNVIATSDDAEKFSQFPSFFDLVVIDAPCSGSGLFRKDPHATDEWSMEQVLLCSRRQKRIVDDVIPSLKQNGILIYATCSYSIEENEMLIQHLLASGQFESANPNISQFDGIIQNQYGFRFYPDKVRGEGFFISALRKITEEKNTKPDHHGNVSFADKREFNILTPWLNLHEKYIALNSGKHFSLLSEKFTRDIETLIAGVKIIRAGVDAGKITGDELVPSHGLAMSRILQNNIPSIEVDKQMAIRYLKKETLQLETERKGWYLINHQGIHLGWIRVVPGRINNYYPIEWRIRM